MKSKSIIFAITLVIFLTGCVVDRNPDLNLVDMIHDYNAVKEEYNTCVKKSNSLCGDEKVSMERSAFRLDTAMRAKGIRLN